MANTTIKSMAVDDRPREKMLLKGRSALSDAELIAILLGSGNTKENATELARRMLRDCSNDLDTLASLSIEDIMKYRGVGEAKAVSIAAALELGRRKRSAVMEKKRISSSADAYNLIAGHFEDLPHEEFMILILNRGNYCTSKSVISRGGISGTVTDIRVIIKNALDKRASGLILAHNHPSGNLQPSNADKTITARIKEAAALFDIAVLDHLIVTNNGYLSFADEGIL